MIQGRNQDINRINKLRNLNILDSAKENEFDSVTEIASFICDAPMSLITLIDDERQWFKAAKGMGDLTEVPVKASFCVHAINDESGEMIIGDLREDNRFEESPFVTNAPNAKFYAGISITTSDGYRLGTVCVLDTKPRNLSEKQIECLRLLADYTVKLIELRTTNESLTSSHLQLDNLNKDLKQYAYSIAHDIKGPLRTMSVFSKFLIKEAKDKLNKKEKEYLHYITSSAVELSHYTQNLLNFSESIQVDTSQATTINLNELVDSIDELINKNQEITIFHNKNLPTIFASEIGLKQVLQNLISNSIRYKKSEIPNPYVIIMVTVHQDSYEFKFTDNGIGISKKQLKRIFELFNKNDDYKESTGVGLNIVKRILEKMNGEIIIESKEGFGTEITFTIPKIMKAV